MKVPSLGEIPTGVPPSGMPHSQSREGTQATAPFARPPVKPAPSPHVLQEEVSNAELEAAVKHANDAIKPSATQFEFSIDQDTGRMIVKLLDAETHSVLRQIPSEEMIAIARALDKLKGVLIKAKA